MKTLTVTFGKAAVVIMVTTIQSKFYHQALSQHILLVEIAKQLKQLSKSDIEINLCECQRHWINVTGLLMGKCLQGRKTQTRQVLVFALGCIYRLKEKINNFNSLEYYILQYECWCWVMNYVSCLSVELYKFYILSSSYGEKT